VSADIHAPPAPLAIEPTLDAAWTRCMVDPAVALTLARTRADAAAHPLEEAFAYVIMAIAHIRQGDPGAARRSLESGAIWLAALTTQTDPQTHRLRALRAAGEGVVRWLERDLAGARERFDHALSDTAVLSRYDQIMIRFWRATVHLGIGTSAEAFHDLLWAYEELRRGDRALFGLICASLGAVLVHAGDWPGAEAIFREALSCEDAIAARGFDVICRSNLSYCLVHTERTQDARLLMAQALQLDRDYLLHRHPGDVYTTIAENLVETGFHREAERYIADMLAESQARHFTLGLATAQWCAGRLAWISGDAERAGAYWCQALFRLRHAYHLTHRWKVIRCITELYVSRRDWRRAWRWEHRFHRAYMAWESRSRSVRLVYARQALELHATRAERDAAQAERTRLAQALTALEAANVELGERMIQIERLQRDLREQAIRDPLTGLYNRRELPLQLEAALQAARADGSPVAMAMIDLDHFKVVNDDRGHGMGDQVLTAASRALAASMPAEAALFRYGGDEFCALLPGLDRPQATARLEAYLEALRAIRLSGENASHIVLSASVGVASFPEDAQDMAGLVDAADVALYRAKRAGRGRVA
jgi:two-component system cell cycle response regulator